jgi:hypothetical protein
MRNEERGRFSMLVPSFLGIGVGSRVRLDLWKEKYIMHLLQNSVESAYPRCKSDDNCKEWDVEAEPSAALEYLSPYLLVLPRKLG